MKVSENMNNNLPKEIFKFLNERGAGLGNVSIILISQVLGLYIPKVEALEKQNEKLQQEKKELLKALRKVNEIRDQMQRQKDVAQLFNMSNMEVNFTGGDNTSGRSISESQAEIEEGKWTLPILQEKKELKE